jgi:charged multivesicular body protein 6
VFKAMEQGTATLQALNEQTNIEDVEKLMEDTAEALAYQEELNVLLGTALDEEDEESILAELADLEETVEGTAATSEIAPASPAASEEVAAAPKVVDSDPARVLVPA